ncbi:hypothetical protein [Halorubrum sp. LN27]|uniref:hypothetical protein n=1 Tax=Halorubrum sp. LN27 TaxID=2801032 RepID=UPI001909224D|nr:hypothetical protein [Halorubrum sp. LN27]
MATDERTSWERQTRSELEPDVGAVDTDDACEQSDHCDREQQYRVPWPNFGSDVALCDYHLARYRDLNPEIWGRVRGLDGVEDPDKYAVIGSRFLTLDEVPEEISVDGEKMRRVALGVDGLALFDSAEPDDDGTVRFRTIGRDLEPRETVEVPKEHAGGCLDWYRTEEGVHELDPDARDALFGGGPDA